MTTSDYTKFPFPVPWKDEARIKVLFAPFRDRTVNPENYDSKMKFWFDTIVEYCFFRGKTHFCKQELQQTFTFEGSRVPACLDTVMDEMRNKGLIRARAEYESDPTNSWSGWAVHRFWKSPLNKIKCILTAPKSDGKNVEEFVHLAVIEKCCSNLQKLFEQPPFSGTLIHYTELKDRLTGRINLSEDSLNMCLQTLYIQQKIGLSHSKDADGNNQAIHLVKIPSKSDNTITITEVDHATHNLNVTKQSLLHQLESLEIEIVENENRARQYVRDNKRVLAKTYLRKKHLLEKQHEKRSEALHNIEMLISNVEDAKHNGIILDAYKYGSKALQDVLVKSNLTFDNVEEVVSDVREAIDMSNEIQDTISKLNETTSHDEEDAIERELRELLGESPMNDLNAPGVAKVENNNMGEQKIPKVDISDADLIAMLDGLEVEENSPVKNVTLNITTGKHQYEL
ncbi:charged multivesicular body protein 7 [Haematobia irritans]|uniref:charged multivesicular body protein 7 n=1 Tax=Haematobia irritans TaxID=7368 RepID=UPI003F5094E8